MDFGDRLRQATEASGFNYSEIAEKIGCSQAYISEMINKKPGADNPGSKIIKGLVSLLNVSADWLLFGKVVDPDLMKIQEIVGRAVKTKEPSPTYNNTESDPIPVVALKNLFTLFVEPGQPKEAFATAGWAEYNPENPPSEWRSRPYQLKGKRAAAFRIEGDSMSPRFNDGELVCVDYDAEPNPGDEAVIQLKDGRIIVRKVVTKSEVSYLLSSFNPQCSPVVIEKVSIEHICPIAELIIRE